MACMASASVVGLRQTSRKIGGGTAFLVALVLAAGAATASEETYLQDLALEIEKSIPFLDEASAPMHAWGLTIGCLQTPEPYASRIDTAAAGLRGVHANLSSLNVPAQYNASHAKLGTGYQQTVDGLTLFASGLRENDLDKVSTGADLLGDGKRNRTEGVSEILGRPPSLVDLSSFLLIIVVGATGTLLVLVYLLARQGGRDRLARVHDEIATCPKCGQVLDQWWTYRRGQICPWRGGALQRPKRKTPPPNEKWGGGAGARAGR